MLLTARRTLPQPGDRAMYHPALPQARRQRVVIAQIFANGRIKALFPNGTWLSLPRHYQRRIAHERYGLEPLSQATD